MSLPPSLPSSESIRSDSNSDEQGMQADALIMEQWGVICDTLHKEVGDTAFSSWIRPIRPAGIRGNTLYLGVATRFMRDWISEHYLERLRVLWQEARNDIEQIVLDIQSACQEQAGGKHEDTPTGGGKGRVSSPYRHYGTPANGSGERTSRPFIDGGRDDAYPEEDTLSPMGTWQHFDRCFTFENFVVGKPNEFAYAAAKRIADSDVTTFNPLFLYGNVGLGKTHLLHAIAWHIHETQPNRRAVFLSAEAFMGRFINALQNKKTLDFKEYFRSADVLMVDDIQFIGNKESTQEEFFHTFNALVEQGHQIVMSADRPPSELVGIEDRLLSRMHSGLVADLHATDYELRLGILQSKAKQQQANVPQSVMEFLAHKITSNVRELEGALNRVVSHSQFLSHDIDLEATQVILKDLLRANTKRLSIEDIQKQVASHFNVRVADMHSARRARAVARPRQVAMYLAKQLTNRSLPEIGRMFGGRDHTTVMHAIKKVDELSDYDPSFAEDVELLRCILENR